MNRKWSYLYLCPFQYFLAIHTHLNSKSKEKKNKKQNYTICYWYWYGLKNWFLLLFLFLLLLFAAYYYCMLKNFKLLLSFCYINYVVFFLLFVCFPFASETFCISFVTIILCCSRNKVFFLTMLFCHHAYYFLWDSISFLPELVLAHIPVSLCYSNYLSLENNICSCQGQVWVCTCSVGFCMSIFLVKCTMGF